ncbi:MAG: hypothetical protein K0S74_1704 [Chlamydiales bacterium]|jgi:hypothetical protein|nr:hypothetical protein [Chlamydiales bacterium]
MFIQELIPEFHDEFNLKNSFEQWLILELVMLQFASDKLLKIEW